MMIAMKVFIMATIKISISAGKTAARGLSGP